MLPSPAGSAGARSARPTPATKGRRPDRHTRGPGGTRPPAGKTDRARKGPILFGGDIAAPAPAAAGHPATFPLAGRPVACDPQHPAANIPACRWPHQRMSATISPPVDAHMAAYRRRHPRVSAITCAHLAGDRPGVDDHTNAYRRRHAWIPASTPAPVDGDIPHVDRDTTGCRQSHARVSPAISPHASDDMPHLGRERSACRHRQRRGSCAAAMRIHDGRRCRSTQASRWASPSPGPGFHATLRG